MSINHKPNSNDVLDAWVILEHLHTAQRKDLRDYLIHQLYYLSEDDVDYFLPQFCTLLVVSDNSLSKQLECFMLHNCLKSIDFAIKSYWNLHAIQFYSKTDQQTSRCDDMRQSLEMIVVNGSLPKNLLMQIPKDIRMKIIKDIDDRHNKMNKINKINTNIAIEEEKKADINITPLPSPPSPPPLASNHSNHSNGHINHILPAPHKHKNINKNVNKNNNNIITSSSDDALSSGGSGGNTSSSSSVTTTSSSSNSTSSSSSSSSDIKKQSLSNTLPKPKKPTNLRKDTFLNGASEYLKKQRRCTYFNAELDFAHFLEGVSSALEQCDRDDRQRLLEDNVRYANKCLPRGLYVPIAHHATDKHKSLLRIVPGESKCLDSKQKVPFLLFCEVEQHDYSTSSPQICEELTESETALLSSFRRKIRKQLKLLDFNYGGLLFMKLKYPKQAPRQLRGDKHSIDFQRNHYLRNQHKKLYKKNNVSCYAGLYVLIDEHRKRKQQKEQQELDKKKKRFPSPKKLKAKIRKPSKGRLSFLKKNKNKNKNKNKSKNQNDNNNITNATNTNNAPQNVSKKKKLFSKNNKLLATPQRSLTSVTSPSNLSSSNVERSIIDDYSVSRSGQQYSDDNNNDQKRSQSQSQSQSRSYSNDQDPDINDINTNDNGIIEISKSCTPTVSMSTYNLMKNKSLISINKVPTPQPKQKDIEAEEAMKRHLQALEPFEPDNHKSPKSNKYRKINNNLNRNRNKHQSVSVNNHLNSPPSLQSLPITKSKSFTQLLSPVIRNKFRSRTPEPNKNNIKNNNKKLYKSDGSDNDLSIINKPMVHINGKPTQIRLNTPPSPPKMLQHSQSSQRISTNRPSSPSWSGTRSGSNGSNGKFNNNNNNNKYKSSPSVVIYRHPNYNQIQKKKIQYLRGKSMSWTHPFGELWTAKRDRFRIQSPFKNNLSWSINSVIFKSGEDMRQEQMAMQFIKLFDSIFRCAKLPLQLRPYSVVVTSPASGFVETVPNSVSISRLKHSINNFVSLRKFFEQYYGPIGSPGFNQAQKNFVESMAGYSLVCYFLQIKDRHNGNILIDCDGRIIHIDFDFLFSNSPGGNIGFESAPFKLTEEFIEVMGGEENSEMFDYFKILLIRGFLEVRKHYRKFLLLSTIMLKGASMPCFLAGNTVITQFKERFAIKLKNEKCVEHVYNLIEDSSCNWRSVQYDKFQRITNNIL